MKYKKSLGEKTFDVFNHLILILLVVVTLYPVWYVIVASVSDPMEVFASKGLLFWPKGFSLESYKEVLQFDRIWVGYRNTLFYVLVGGGLSVLLTVITAFCLTRKDLPGKNFLMFVILLTMYFSGGMIPSYLLVKNLGMLNTVWAILLPGAISVGNLIMTISYFRGLPDALEEAAKIDGASDYTVLFKIFIPLAKPIIAVIALYYMVARWNEFMHALIYLQQRRDLHPLQLVLREILIQNDTTSISGTVNASDAQAYSESMKYAVVVVSTIPIMCVYPFIQKYFVKGVTIGAVKG